MCCSGWAWWRCPWRSGRCGGRFSPVRTVYRLVCLAIGRRARRYPEWLGYWPAAAGLFAFVWLELAGPDPASLVAIRYWLLGYVAVTFAGAMCCGEPWLSRADPFDV